ncbi:hypothetical protein OG204_34075 [Streptomyces sp. NBC_01387]|uniref:hypothetical protein n=1 Tax=unclassified Streptomyces TaxID=2593676 RepID=UPI0020259293|nr:MULTISPECIES: hypothetical protein [unclassified Streptomyces]MCX4553372.1 hypothetical protein [Streptomyces sp. NBC_01500]WSC18335.1 hypothetical protein OIE60_01020 [Streptomyces sp. NBC_01766]WSV52377.1 hypothetical protein OG282_01080 [Streptomyces sp. NBC_01014]
MRITRILPQAALAGLALFATAGTAAADTPSPSPSSSSDSNGAPSEAGTAFRTATVVAQGQHATASASTGDYLYWVFPADSGQAATVTATVKLPEAASRHGASTWQVDVYDGLRRRQSCMYGSQTRVAAADAESVTLTCHLRTVRSWAEPWANDPLPGSYYIRLTVLDLPQEDLGLPVQADVVATAKDSGGSHAVDGALSVPLTSDASSASAAQPTDSTGTAAQTPVASRIEPEDGWSSGWWSDRWLWTVGGGVLGALAAVAGYRLSRGPGPSRRVPMA